ncbi:MAG: paraquat-inducible protein A [Methyloprofundus sp.]|nr:paraquat-inducible protein A [Methyloprofundus sp.]MDT8425459.1 paraquat-inducible protein A [Methyloprofundus sp.]
MMRSTLNIDNAQHIEACPDCDLLITEVQVKEGYVSHCPRCRHIIEHPTRLSIRNNFFCVFAGLIVYFPAMLLPVLQFTVLGHTEVLSILVCVQTLFSTGNWGVGLVVFFSLMLVPLVQMILIIFITTRFYYQVKSHYLALCFKWYGYLSAWGMLDIFMLSIIVAAIKLRDDAELEPGLGLYAFIALLLISALQTQLLNKKLVWTLIEKHGE